MNEYLLLFRGGENRRAEAQQNPQKWQAHRTKWKNWMEELEKAGKFVSGQPLNPGGAVISGARKAVTERSFAEDGTVVGGYLMIRAENHAEAIALSKDCPVLEMEGTIEIREIGQSPVMTAK